MAEETLWVNDAELIRRLGLPEKLARQRLKALDDKPMYGFPQKSKFWGNRRYWPAVKAYMDAQNGLNLPSPQPQRRAS